MYTPICCLIAYNCGVAVLNTTLREDLEYKHKAVRAISKLRFRDSSRNPFKDMGFLTLHSLYILEIAFVVCRFKCKLVQGGNVPQYSTRSRDNYRIGQLKTSAVANVPSQVRLINNLIEE